MTRLDPDPLYVDEEMLWDPQAGEWVPRPSGLIALLTGLTLGVVIGFLVAVNVVHAAPRTTVLPPPADVSSFGAPLAGPLSETVDPVDAVGSGAPQLRDTAKPSSSDASAVSTPSPARTRAVSGVASWYRVAGLVAAAGPALRHGHWRGSTVLVSANGRSVRVTLVDWCACPQRLIDLSRTAFARLADPSVGLVRVTVSRG